MPGAALQQGDAITHVVHRHEPSVQLPAVRILQSEDDSSIVAVCKSTLPVHPSGRYHRNTVVAVLDACHGLPDLLRAPFVLFSTRCPSPDGTAG